MMPTTKQQTAISNMVENGGNVSKAMRDAGYSPNTAKTPKKLTKSLGFVQMCESYGLTEELLLEALVEDIKLKKGNRKAELELGFKIKGLLSGNNSSVSVNVESNELSEVEKIKLELLLNDI